MIWTGDLSFSSPLSAARWARVKGARVFVLDQEIRLSTIQQMAEAFPGLRLEIRDSIIDCEGRYAEEVAAILNLQVRSIREFYGTKS